MSEAIANFDKNGEVINGEKTYGWIAHQLKRHNSCLVGWHDGTAHYDMTFLFSRSGIQKIGKSVNIKNTYLFVGILGVGSLSIELNSLRIGTMVISHKLGDGYSALSSALAELISEVKVRL